MTSAAKVGIFMLIVLAILGFFILRIEDIKISGRQETRTVKALFGSVAGLQRKATVRVAGVEVGKVKDITLRDGKAEVTMDLTEDVPLRENASAQVVNLGLLGEKYVEINPGAPPAPLRVSQGEVTLPGSSPTSIDEVTNQVSEIATDVKAITASLRSAMGGPGGEQRFDEIVENIRDVTASLRTLIDANSGTINVTAVNLRAMTDDLRVEIPKIAVSIDRVAASLAGTVSENREDIRLVVENLRTLSGDLRKTTDNLNAITGQVKSGEGTLGKLLYNTEAYDKLNRALTSVEGGVTELRTSIGRANKLGLDFGIRGDYYAGLEQDKTQRPIDTNSRAGVTLRLIPDPQKNRFYSVELMDDPKGTKKEKVVETTVTDASGAVLSATRTLQTKFERGFLISAQAGWRIGDVDLRAGLFDSSGGIGADYDLADRLRVSAEAFDFAGKRDEELHLRLFGQYTFRKDKPNFPALFLSSGVDNVFNDFAFTFGGGVRWRDDDLKYLLGSIPLR